MNEGETYPCQIQVEQDGGKVRLTLSGISGDHEEVISFTIAPELAYQLAQRITVHAMKAEGS